MAESFTVARPYAKAIFRIADESKDFDKWQNALDILSFIVQNADVAQLITNQTITKHDKAKFIVEVTANQLDDKAKNFIFLLAEENRLDIIPEISKLFEEYKDEALNKLEVTVTSATKLLAAQKKEYIEKLKKYFNKDIIATFNVDKALLGGIVVRAKDTVIDFSLKGKLNKLREALVT